MAAPNTAAAKASARTSTKRKTAPRKRTAATASRKTGPRKTVAKRGSRRTTPDLSTRAQEVGRNAFLAGLGFYGTALDRAQARLDSLQTRLQAQRKAARKTYTELVKRGTRVEKNALSLIDELELPNFELTDLTDRRKLEARLGKARSRLDGLRSSAGF
ncbi:hypothetical protein [Kineobactrum salinum]|uniref:Phasin family protein n=1 Tax=Kineobactrum salinum TaxID=2708301 RepID=A0A6C0U0Z0_9GAMM|nr:hypothetical protein [Kineobactrum salinum]QIB65229.1 hypothetical protein G3T16_07250 [Kineobactrum salinum]